MVSFRKVYQRVSAHKRVIALVLILACAAVLNAPLLEFGTSLYLIFLAILLLLIASQVFWLARVVDLAERLLPGRLRRGWLTLVVALLYAFFFLHSYPSVESTNIHVFRAADWRLSSVIIEAAFWWWLVGSLAGFVLLIGFGVVDRAVRGAVWALNRLREAAAGRVTTSEPGAIAVDPPSPARRRFLEKSALAASATPFLAAGYGLLYERLDVEVTHQRIRLARLPKAFEAFRIVHLSDVHISPFMTGKQIRRSVATVNQLKPDLIVMTGDYITWDPEAQSDVVNSLAGLRAPYGVFGCLGNHEESSSTEGSISRLFAVRGIRMLRQESVPIRLGGEAINLIGMDDPRGRSEADFRLDLHRRMKQVKALMMPDTANILLVHYPDVFRYAAGLGIDLTLAGHTHGGQLSLEFIHRGLTLSHLMSRYDSGLYEQGGRQLYVNRGLGTIGFPIRFGCRPEITVMELVKA